jgi:fructose-1,6-bisphosphatase I
MFFHRANARYIGALVADVHNILINGGIYGYPSTRDNPNGKLRLLYECAPMSMIIEQAGGAGSTGRGRILDVQPTEIHQRTPIFLGSVENVFELDQFFQYCKSRRVDVVSIAVMRAHSLSSYVPGRNVGRH